MSNLCPHCQRPMPRPKTAKPYVSAAVDTATLSTDELFAYYKRIGTREDCRFWLSRARAIPEAIRAEGEALLAELETRDGKPADAKRLASLKFRAPQPFKCGHTHHTSLKTAEACYLGLLDEYYALRTDHDDWQERQQAANDQIEASLGWVV